MLKTNKPVIRKLFSNKAGDTIVEVLIAIGIVSSVLVGAFTISNLSLKQIRSAQERSEAQKVAEQAVENLDSMAAAHPDLLTRDTADTFCKASNSEVAIHSSESSPNPVCLIQGKYLVTIKRIVPTGAPANQSSFTFRVDISWDSISNTGRDKLSISYRVLTVRDTT